MTALDDHRTLSSLALDVELLRRDVENLGGAVDELREAIDSLNYGVVDELKEMLITDRMRCADCGGDTAGDGYMVRDDIWAQARAPRLGRLHTACLEKRLGRQLVDQDYTDAPINIGRTPEARSLPSLGEAPPA